MKKILFIAIQCLCFASLWSQPAGQKIKKAFLEFENDSQLKHALLSLYVIDAKTGQVVFDRNSQVGLAGASTQKVVTAATAFELLGKDYRYKTILTRDSQTIYVSGFGDPTLGSWRYQQSRDSFLFPELVAGLRKAGISSFKNLVVYDNYSDKVLPRGWINEDIGNYYGAGAHDFNWHENQYDLVFIPGKKAGDAAPVDTSATPRWWEFLNECRTGVPGSGDNAYIYFVPGGQVLVLKGTVPAGPKRFTISGADPFPYRSFSLAFNRYAAAAGIFKGDPEVTAIAPWARNDGEIIRDAVFTHYSPALDSIVYWFLKKSINLYGEALVKTFAYEKLGSASSDSGVAIVKKFWKQKGLDEDELNIYDGSGLSPINRLTTHAEVEALKFARSRTWFPYFFDALPEFNGMKMKSGTISDVKGFCGYQKANDGKEYIFSFLVNNYNGLTSTLVAKMYKVLDELK